MTDDTDLAALREFRSDLDEPRDGGLAQGRYRLARTAAPPRGRRRQWVLASAGAAAAVTLVVAGATVMAPHRSSQTGGPPAAVATSAAPGTDLPVTQGTRAPVNPPVAGASGATHAKAVAAMDRLANAAAGAEPWQLATGEVLYVKTYNLHDGDGRYIHEVWQDAATGVALRIRRTDGATTNIDDFTTQADIDRAVTEAPDIDHPTLAYVDGLPADPQALLTSWRQWAQRLYPDRDADTMLWKDLYELYHYSEPFWTPKTRAAIYHAIASMPAVEATTVTIGGTQYDAVCMPAPGADPQGSCQLYDSATGRYAGNADTGADLVVKADRFEFVDFGTQPRPPVGAPEPAGSTKPTKQPSHVPTKSPKS